MGACDTLNTKADRIAIIGTGLLGASLGLGLRKAGYTGRLLGVGRRQSTLDKALALGAIDEATTDLSSMIAGTKLVVLATPLRAFDGYLDALARHVHMDMVITDVGSTKQHVCALARKRLPTSVRFVGSHPMAGGEQHGPQHARQELFRNKPCIMTPEAGTDPQAVTLVEALWKSLGMHVITMTPAAHDRQVAVISHLPHAVAVLLVELAVRYDALAVASSGFRDTTRVASGDAEVWLDIFQTNRAATMKAIDALAGELQVFRQALDANDSPKLEDLLRRAKTQRDQWVQRGGE